MFFIGDKGGKGNQKVEVKILCFSSFVKLNFEQVKLMFPYIV